MMWSKDSRRIDPISRSAKPFLDGSLQRHFTGTGIQHFTGEALKRFRIPLPTLSEQQRLVVILDEAFAGLATAAANAEKNLLSARELFDDCLTSLFGKPAPNFGDYPADFFDFIVIDECHRGGANDEGNWRGILEYFSPAFQLGLTATPKRKGNVDTYAYFGEPVYVYSLKQGINDGFLTPFKVKQIATTLDDYVYTSDDQLVEGEVEEGKRYKEPEFNRTIEIVEREKYRVKLFMSEIDQREKTLVFCATQGHALLVRDLINQIKTSKDPHYCERVTAKDGSIGDQHLREFQDNEKTIPTILTTARAITGRLIPQLPARRRFRRTWLFRRGRRR
jgi:hypothetical protein